VLVVLLVRHKQMGVKEAILYLHLLPQPAADTEQEQEPHHLILLVEQEAPVVAVVSKVELIRLALELQIKVLLVAHQTQFMRQTFTQVVAGALALLVITDNLTPVLAEPVLLQ
jgi:hypothetical protein